FRARWGTFWARMALVAGSLGLYASVVSPNARRERLTVGDVAGALASAGGLYGVFQGGDRLARLILPRGQSEIASIYELKKGSPPWLTAILLAGVIAPSEELFWRGLVQKTLMSRLGPTRGALAATLCYGGVHLGSGNLTLSAAALAAGAGWGAQYALQRRLPSAILSHVLWDVWIFLVAPTPGGRLGVMSDE